MQPSPANLTLEVRNFRLACKWDGSRNIGKETWELLSQGVVLPGIMYGCEGGLSLKHIKQEIIVWEWGFKASKPWNRCGYQNTDHNPPQPNLHMPRTP